MDHYNITYFNKITHLYNFPQKIRVDLFSRIDHVQTFRVDKFSRMSKSKISRIPNLCPCVTLLERLASFLSEFFQLPYLLHFQSRAKKTNYSLDSLNGNEACLSLLAPLLPRVDDVERDWFSRPRLVQSFHDVFSIVK